MGKEFRGRFWARCSLCYSCPILWYWFPPPQVFSHFCQIPQIHLLPEVTTSHYRRPRSSSYVDHRAADSSDWAINLNRGSIRDGAATPHTPAPASTTTHDARSRSVPTQESAFAATTCSMNRIPHNFATVYSFNLPCSFCLFLSLQSSNIRSPLSHVHRIIS